MGSNLDDFLREEQLLDTTEATAVKRVIVFQIEREMKRRRLTKTEMASGMKTSRMGLSGYWTLQIARSHFLRLSGRHRFWRKD